MRHFIQRYGRHIAIFFLVNIIAEVVSPSVALALTSGPNQPEVQEFQPINVSDMVDPSTGDFSYNLPLLEVDGYPVNLSYRAGVSMDQEATYVGLGWNMNVGSISRNLRGLPDDFNGEKVVKKLKMKDNESYGITTGIGGEIFGIDAVKANFSTGLTYNNYTGYDFFHKIGLSLNVGAIGIGLGLQSSGNGLTISPNLSLQANIGNKENGSLRGSVSAGTSFNSRTGIKEVNLSANVSLAKDHYEKKDEKDQSNKRGKFSGTENFFSIGNGSSITFGSPTYVPQITTPMHTKSVSGSFKLGGSVVGMDASGDIGGNYSRQSVKEVTRSFPAYGYLNLHNGQKLDDAMLDFNREKDGVFSEATTDLAIPNLTYDNFSVMGQGTGGAYRPFRGDVGYVYDARASNTSESYDMGGEVKLGNIVQAGVDYQNNTVEGTSGKWITENGAVSVLGFEGSGALGYEPAYFKEMGEMNVDDDPLYTTIKEESAVRFEPDDLGGSTGIKKELITENSVIFNITGKTKREKRVKRNKLFSYLTVAECEHFALQTGLFQNIARFDGSNLINGSQIGEITTTNTDGMRYVYGLPALNTYQKEVSFNVSGFSGGQYNAYENFVDYLPAIDDSELNGKGIDGFFSSTELPGYAYGYMLTAVLSADYVDKTGNGPTADDIGSYTVFHYDVAVKNYSWRSPHSSGPGGGGGIATLDEGLLSRDNDNKASYVYGTKDIYYLSAIEGRNSVAVLDYSTRQDGCGVTGDAGGTNSNAAFLQKKLNTITLYSKMDYDLMQANPLYVPFVMKQVHFKYNYELCPGVYNFTGSTANGDGKLTLKEVYFTYGQSNKGILSPYKFNYNLQVGGTIIGYSPSSVDRWGNYKQNRDPVSCPNCLPNSKYPYVEQDKTIEDQNVALWNLKSIQLPSGGLMEIDYESDDYAYIQNKRAGEMFKIVGASDFYTTPFGNQLFSGTTINSYLFFELKNTIPANITTFREEYIGAMSYLYFKVFTKVNSSNTPDISPLIFGQAGYEFVSGYAEIDRNPANNLPICGITNFSGTDYGYVKVKEVRQSKTNQSQENPISKAAWQMARLQTPKEAYAADLSGSDPASGKSDAEAIFRAIADAGFIKNTIQAFKGYNGTLRSKNIGWTFEPSLSWMRLQNPDYKKLGGGHRVKNIQIRDQWDQMLANTFSASQNFQYGQQYEYTTYEEGRQISAGVASYEPGVGADENTFRKPVFMDMHKEEALLAPDNDMFIEEPFGESFFPSPSVVYSTVTIKNLVSGTGQTVNEYFTARDFPTYVHQLHIWPARKTSNPIKTLFTCESFDHFTGSQGFSIELNDMHGKPKAVHVYEEGAAAPVKSVVYRYKRSGDKLVNMVKTVSKDGTIKDSRIGIDYDFYADFRENTTYTESLSVEANVYIFFTGFPFMVPPIIPISNIEDVHLRTAVTNKVIYRYGILEGMDTFEGGNVSSTDNLLWDAETGQVLLTAATTEFNDPIYTTAYPGHWAYEGLSGGYKNVGLDIPNPASIVMASGQISSQSHINMLYPGDELILNSSSGSATKGYVDKIGSGYFFTENQAIAGVASSIPLDKTALAKYSSIKVIRSGRHNLQDQKVGAITSLASPLKNNPSSWPKMDETYEITAATSVELGNTWQGYCGCNFTSTGLSSNPYANQYLQGIKGNYRVIKDYTYLTSRKQTRVNGNTNIRVDGTFEKFSPFWLPHNGNDWQPDRNNWTWVSEATKYSPQGADLENQDALERRSAAQYGYNQLLPVAVCSNSKYKHAANENFEYSMWDVCQDDHFGYHQHKSSTYDPGSPTIARVQKYSHTGKRSIAVPPTGTVTVTRQINACQN